MKYTLLICILFFYTVNAIAQVVIDPKGTKITIDSSKWKISGINIYNKNSGNLGIGTTNPTAKLHTTGDLRFEGIGTNTINTKILTADALGNITTRLFSSLLSNNSITNTMLAQVPTQVFKGRTSAGTGDVEDLSTTQATAMLNTFTSSAKGLVPASGGGTTTFLRADGTFAAPSGNSTRNVVTLTTDVTTSAVTANLLEDVTGLSFDIVAGTLYRFYAIIPFTSTASSNGSRWTINAPASSLLTYTSRYTLTASSETVNYANAINFPPTCNATSNPNGNLAIIQGIIRPTANGTVQVRFASDKINGGTSITAKAGATLEYW